jgi:predicted nucleotidyltransferase
MIVVDTHNMLDFRSKARRQLLIYFFANPSARLYLRELAEKIEADPANLSRELGGLVRKGLFLAEFSGNQKFVRLNRAYPLFHEFRRIISKTIGAPHVISEFLRKMNGIEEAFLFGSFARDQQDASSDIDILVIGAPRPSLLAQAVRRLKRALGREVHCVVLSRKEFKARRARRDVFLSDVLRHKRVPLLAPLE